MPTNNKRFEESKASDRRYNNNKYENDDEEVDDFDYGFDNNDDKPVAMSASLMKALGMHVAKSKIKTDWKPPSKPGLANSSRLIPENNSLNLMEFEESRLYKRQHSGLIKSVILSNASQSKAPTSRTYDSDDDDYGFDEDRPVNMSHNLLVALGLEAASPNMKKLETDWKPPTRAGLDNSSRIISIKSSPGHEVKIHYNDNNKSNTNSNNNTSNHSTSKGQSPNDNNKQQYNENKQAQYEEDENEDDGEDDDWGYDDDDDEEGGGLDKSVVMSANLMKALGMDISGVDTTTDWKPPEFTGVANSERIIK